MPRSPAYDTYSSVPDPRRARIALSRFSGDTSLVNRRRDRSARAVQMHQPSAFDVVCAVSQLREINRGAEGGIWTLLCGSGIVTWNRRRAPANHQGDSLRQATAPLLYLADLKWVSAPEVENDAPAFVNSSVRDRVCFETSAARRKTWPWSVGRLIFSNQRSG